MEIKEHLCYIWYKLLSLTLLLTVFLWMCLFTFHFHYASVTFLVLLNNSTQNRLKSLKTQYVSLKEAKLPV